MHRVGIDRLADLPGGDAPWLVKEEVSGVHRGTVDALAASSFPQQAFAYRVALLAEWLVEHEGIDVIEAQEWEAPLAFFQLRRALGLGPAPRPPCLVNLHSPTEFIFRHNEWSTNRSDYVPAVRLEDYTIGAADGWLCPSRFLARQAGAHYGIPPESIEVIPLPRGDTAIAVRDAATWRDGTICFVGRLEPRKGVLEWVDAAIRVLDNHPRLHFEFIGSDVQLIHDVSVKDALEHRIPGRHRKRFRFRGAVGRAELMERLAQARMSVVPSRWENFPNSCLEAMASGIPVLVSPDGGMSEMVVDGESGWIAPSTDAAGLEAALRRALATPPERFCTMGAAAAERVRDICDNDAIVARHREFRQRLIERGTTNSGAVPQSFPWSRLGARTGLPTPAADSVQAGASASVAMVMIAEPGVPLAACIASVASQHGGTTRRILVSPEAVRLPDGWDAARDLDGALALLAHGAGVVDECEAIAIVEAGHALHPDFLRSALAALRAHPRLGVVAPWTLATNGSCHGGAAPVFPYHLLDDHAGGALVFRASALHGVGRFPSTISARYWCWDASAAVMAMGWGAVTWPQILARRLPPTGRDHRTGRMDQVEAHVGWLQARRAILERASPAIGTHAVELVMDLEARQASTIWQASPDAGAALEMLDTPARLRWAASVMRYAVRSGLRQPVRSARWFVPRLWRVSRRSVDRMMGRRNGGEEE